MIVVVGAGLTGLSTAYHLKKRPCCIIEQDSVHGGLCRSVKMEGFTFDYSGHLLHSRHEHTRRLLDKLLPGACETVKRRAAIYCCNTYLNYPFQANLYGLPRELVFECVTGFLAAARKKGSRRRVPHFKKWVLQTFGEGIANTFFIPYNEKLWLRDLKKLTSEWAGWSVPRPTVEEVIGGALGIHNSGMGYNATFVYPRSGGIQVLSDALARHVGCIHTGLKLTAVNLSEHTARLSDGSAVTYDTLVSTMPLPALLAACEDLPPALKQAAPRLESVAVCAINLAINRARACDFHWAYFPETEFPFYRVGCYSNIMPGLAPRSASSFYIEWSLRPDEHPEPEYMFDASVEGLRRCGILSRRDRVVARHSVVMSPAYAVFDRYRKTKLSGILRYLRRNKVLAAGRYGSWTYAAMEDALLEGRRIAEMLQDG